MNYPIAFACWGCHLRGRESGTVDRQHNAPGTPALEVDSGAPQPGQKRLDQAPSHLDQTRRVALLEAIQEVCAHRGFRLLAAHVRSNHVYTVVEAGVPPERVNRTGSDGSAWQYPVLYTAPRRCGEGYC